MNLPYFPPTGPYSDRCVSLVELYIDGTGLYVCMLFLVDHSHLLGGYLVSSRVTLRQLEAAFIRNSADYIFRYLSWDVNFAGNTGSDADVARLCSTGNTGRQCQLERLGLTFAVAFMSNHRICPFSLRVDGFEVCRRIHSSCKVQPLLLA